MHKLPDYITVDHYYKIKDIKDISTNQGFVNMVSLILDVDVEEVKTWDINEVKTLFTQVIRKLDESKPEFYPIIEFKDEVWGFQPPSKMTLGEWIDFEELIKNTTTNLHKICSILYRPITKHNWKNPVWKLKYNWKTMVLKQSTNPFDIYNVEKYDAEVSKEREDMMLDFPIQAAQGALAFFLVLGLKYSEGIQTSLLPQAKELLRKTNEIMTVSLFQNTMDTSLHSTTLAKQISLALQEIKDLQT